MKFTAEQAIQKLKDSQELPDWVRCARNNHKMLKALVKGDGFKDVLIEHIEHLESKEKAKARKKYSKDIRDLFHRVMKKRDNVFEANGGSEKLLIENKRVKEDFLSVIAKFKSNKSLFKYLSEYYFQLCDTDPNGLMFMEYQTLPEVKVYPTYKSINDIREYEPDGQMIEYVIFEPLKKPDARSTIWRLVDDQTDWTIIENSGVWIVDKEHTFEHTFGKTPGVILSGIEKTGTNERLSAIAPVEENAKDYARDKSILTIYKFLNGFTKEWRYVSNCRHCTGTGKTGADQTPCTSCDGKGILMKADVTDLITIEKPKHDEPIITPDIAGFISPDLETWKQYKEDLRDWERLIADTIWGTETIQEGDKENKTATGEYLDVQPTVNTLNRFTDQAEFVYNTLAHFALNFVDTVKPREEVLHYYTFGRNYILESPDTILKKYQDAKLKNDNNTILDKLLEEWILSKYKSDPHMQELMLKKASVEPYVHQSIAEINGMLGPAEGYKKILFEKFWQTVDTTKTTEQLDEEFKTYFKDESSEVLQAVKQAQERQTAGPV